MIKTADNVRPEQLTGHGNNPTRTFKELINALETNYKHPDTTHIITQQSTPSFDKLIERVWWLL